jgi:hypothetical protein
MFFPSKLSARCTTLTEEASTPPMTAAEESKIAALVKKAVS